MRFADAHRSPRAAFPQRAVKTVPKKQFKLGSRYQAVGSSETRPGEQKGEND
jgi:hypothetical protein